MDLAIDLAKLVIDVTTAPESTTAYARYARNMVNIHVVGMADVCWVLWKLMGMACFEKKANQVIGWKLRTKASFFTIYWAGLQKE
jgi:hypothetical protein